MSQSKPAKKMKVNLEHRVFNERWAQKYFCVQNKDRAVCLIFNDIVSLFKEWNINQHCSVCHKKRNMMHSKVGSESRRLRVQITLSDEQNVFKTKVDENLAAVQASFHVAKLIAQGGRPFADGKFVKRCFMSMAEELFPYSH
jgi:hypothetical protein